MKHFEISARFSLEYASFTSSFAKVSAYCNILCPSGQFDSKYAARRYKLREKVYFEDFDTAVC